MERVKDIEPVQLKNRKVPVNQYELSGKFVQQFESIAEASKQTGISHAMIGQCVNLKLKTAGSYQWKKAN